MITARELDVARLPTPARVWVNLALKYTHGYGVVAVPVNEIDSRGNPVLWAHDIPIVAKKDLSVVHGEIYFGKLTWDRVYVRTTEKEFDFPQGQANAETIYQGKGGIPLSNAWRKLVVAREFDGLRLFISGYFTPESRVMLRRNVVERVQTLAPISELRSRSLYRRRFQTIILTFSMPIRCRKIIHTAKLMRVRCRLSMSELPPQFRQGGDRRL